MTNASFWELVEPADFWTTVKSLGWGVNTTDYKAINTTLKKRGKKWCENFHTQHLKALHNLKNATLKHLGRPLCSDSFDDVTAHIIGLGEAEYDACMANPQRVLDRMDGDEYTESFSYAVPSGYDFR